MFGRSRDEYTAGTSCGDERQRGLAEIRQAVQPVGLAANHLQGPGLITWHVLDHLLSLVQDTVDDPDAGCRTRYGWCLTPAVTAGQMG